MSVFGKYQFAERLGRGGMGEVYRARVQGEGDFSKEFAIKRIHSEVELDTESVRLFEREAKLSGLFTHPNLVHVYDFFKVQDSYFLVMEYVNGKNLQQLQNKLQQLGRPLSLALAVHIICEVSKGLDYAFTKKDPSTNVSLEIIHRDISPHNIMISKDGAVKLADFGIAKAKGSNPLTDQGMIRGKCAYLSPEQAAGKPLDHRSDIFSTCIVLFELVTGRKLYSASDDVGMLLLAQRAEVPDIAAELPSKLHEILRKGLAKEPEQRYADVSSLLVELHALVPGTSHRLSKELGEVMQSAFPGESNVSVGTQKPDFWDSLLQEGDRKELLGELDKLAQMDSAKFEVPLRRRIFSVIFHPRSLVLVASLVLILLFYSYRGKGSRQPAGGRTKGNPPSVECAQEVTALCGADHGRARRQCIASNLARLSSECADWWRPALQRLLPRQD